MDRASLENAVIYSNRCLKRWGREKTHLLTFQNIRSLVNGWLVRVLSREPMLLRRSDFTRKVSRDLFVSFNLQRLCITGIIAGELTLPVLDFEELDRRSVDEEYASNVDQVNFSSIQLIKFN